MLAEGRQQIIFDTVNRLNIISVAELSKRLKTSEVTVRKDLTELELLGKLRRTRGGAVRIDYDGASFEPMYSQLQNENYELKWNICKAAYAFVDNKSAIIIDASSTAGLLCKFIREDPRMNLTVVTNSAYVLTELSGCEHVDVIMLGGQVRKHMLSCAGPLADLMLGQLHVDKAFLGINGVDFKNDLLTTPSIIEAGLKRSMIACARESIILADNTKLSRTALSRVCAASAVDMIIVDSETDPSALKEAEECGAKLLRASP